VMGKRHHANTSALVLFFCLTYGLASSADAICATQNIIDVPGDTEACKEQQQQNRLEVAKVSHIRHILIERLQWVSSGRRARDFEKWASNQGDLKVISMHGADEVDIDFDLGDATGAVNSSNGLFPDDVVNLALVPIPAFPSQYQGNPFHLEQGPISLVNLFFRSIQLGFNFAPVASTAWLALLSPTFREKIWFSWVATCLAASGPAFIKWGELTNCFFHYIDFSACSLHYSRTVGIYTIGHVSRVPLPRTFTVA